MSRREKLAILRIRAKSLHGRAVVVERAFTNAGMIRRAASVRAAIEAELERLDVAGADPLPSLKAFLPGPAALLKELETILHRDGPNARSVDVRVGPPAPQRKRRSVES
jgi:hypothetical protein